MFYKKFISLVIALSIMVGVFIMGGQMLFAKAESADLQDQCFLEFIGEDVEVENINYTSIDLYNANLQPHARQYVFTDGNVFGYAITAKVQVGENFFYEVEELFYNTPAPFVNYQGLPVYLTFNSYIDYIDGVFYDLSNNRAVVEQETIQNLVSKGFGFCGNANVTFTHSTETINYHTKTTQSYSFPYSAPNLFGSVNGSCCANTAGTVLIGYYDRFYEDLIPDFQSYYTFGSNVIYKSTGIELDNVEETLMDYMSVNGIQNGTTFNGFQQGMNRYVREKGYTYTTTSLMSSGNLNLQNYIQTVEQEKPVALFLNAFTMFDSVTADSATQETLSNGYCTATHVEVGIGYKIETYYDEAGNVITTRNYLRVVSGLAGYQIGYLNISANANGQMVRAIAININ